MQQSPELPRVNYGIDAPYQAFGFLAIGLLGVALGLGVSQRHWLHGAGIRWVITITCFSNGGLFLVTALLMLWGSRVGKIRLVQRVMRQIDWHGDERVLDVGCGHGLMLIAAAGRLTTGCALGVDVWRTYDQAGNSRRAAQANLELTGVADRAQLQDADARQLPQADGSFDVVLSSWVIHNISDADGRLQAVREMARVLRPGGRLVIIDILYTRHYARELMRLGFVNVRRIGPNYLFGFSSYTLSAVKPA